MNRIQPGCIPEEEITWEGARSKQKNIAMFLEAIENYGVPKAKLFHMEDLLQLRHIPRVTRCIYALAKLVISLDVIYFFCLYYLGFTSQTNFHFKFSGTCKYFTQKFNFRLPKLNYALGILERFST